MNIAIIGYGSLIWDLDDLAPKVTGEWQRGAGPKMPVEFARVSLKRKMALALVIHNDVSEASSTSCLTSKRSNLEQAAIDLAERERTQLDHIGYAVSNGDCFSRNDDITTNVMQWLVGSPFDAAVWTDLDGNFDEHIGAPFSHDTGLAYLRTLTGHSLREAWRYISFAPMETDTPFRRHLAADDWWCSLSYGADETVG